MKNSKFLIVALLSISLIGLELIWTRIFSAEYFYTFAFLILSLAVLGLGLGALALRLFKFLNRESVPGIALTLAGLMIIVGPALVFQLDLSFSVLFNDVEMAVKLLAAIIILSSTYFFAGISLAYIFKKNHAELPNLYMADLLGAGAGAILAIILMNWVGTPIATALCAIPLLLAALLLNKNSLKIVPLLLIISVVYFAPDTEPLLEAERQERAPVIYKHWDALSKIKIYGYNEYYRGINIDNAANTGVLAFDGNWDALDTAKIPFDLDVSYLVERSPDCVFLSLGAGGGMDVFQALQAGAAEAHAVEVNGHINDLMLTGELSEFSGNIYNDPRVKVVTEDARAYVKRFENKFDVIYSLSSNSFSALASGAFALAENYLFTTEAFEDYYRSLSEKGVMMMEHQFYMPRLVTQALNALKNLGVENPQDHITVFNLPKMRRNMIIFSKQPITEELRNNAVRKAPEQARNYYYALYPVEVDSLKSNLINRIVTEGWENVQADADIDISPSDDNRPFAAQLGLWKNFGWDKLSRVTPYEFFGFPLSKMMMTIVLIIVLVIIVPLNILPYFFKGEKLRATPWLYFFAIGAGFMMIEVVLMQKYALFIGPSVYSVSTILLTLLIASGIGSRFAAKFSEQKIFGGILIWLLLDIFVFKYLFDAFSGLEMFPRMLIAAILIAPGGFFMGMPFPKAGLKVKELIDWGFAVNGAASVIGSTIIVLVAIEFGFNIALFAGGLMYLFAYLLINKKSAW